MAKGNNNLRPINAPIYSIWQAVYMSFYSMRLYIDVGKRWSGFGLRYLLLMLALWSIPMTVKLGGDFNEMYYQQLIRPLSMIPSVYIQNGDASFDKPMPYMIKDNKGDVIVIVDTTGKVSDFTNDYPKLTMLINKNKFGYRMPALSIFGEAPNNARNKPSFQFFNESDNFVFDGKYIVSQKLFTQLTLMVKLMIYPLIFSIVLGIFVFLFFVFGLLGQLFAQIFFSFKINVKTSIRLLIVAATPMMLVLLCLELLKYLFPGFGFILTGILTLYFSFAVFSLKSESGRMVNI